MMFSGSIEKYISDYGLDNNNKSATNNNNNNNYNYYNYNNNNPPRNYPSMICFQDFRVNCINSVINGFPNFLEKIDQSESAQGILSIDPIISMLRNQFLNHFKKFKLENEYFNRFSAGFSPQPPLPPLVMIENPTTERNNEILPTSSVCALCGRIFRFEKNLQRHLERNHSAIERESLLKCKMCHYTTRHYSNMYVHIRTHTGDKPYYCAACGASFTQGSSLKLHIKSRHQDNMKYFALSKKPRKSNLTKLWSRVYKSEIGQISPIQVLQSCRHSTSSLLISPNIWTKTESMQIIEKNSHNRVIDLFGTDQSSLSAENLTVTKKQCQTTKKLSYSVQFMIE